MSKIKLAGPLSHSADVMLPRIEHDLRRRLVLADPTSPLKYLIAYTVKKGQPFLLIP